MIILSLDYNAMVGAKQHGKHVLGHIYEVLNWIHIPILLIAIGLCMRWTEKRQGEA